MVATCTCLYAQKFEKYTTEQGVSLDNIYCIAQDFEGYMYFGANKLDIYDGNTFTFLNPGMSPEFGKQTKAIQALTSTKILIGTEDKGLFLFDKESNLIYNIQLGDIKPENLPVTSLHLDKKGIIWIGTLNKGLYSIDINSITKLNNNVSIECFKYEGFEQKTISSICSSKNKIWIGTGSDGVYYIDKSIDTKQAFAAPILFNSPIIWDVKIYNDSLFIGSEDGLILYEMNSGKQSTFLRTPIDRSFTRNIIRAITKDNSGTFWVGTQDDGLYSIRFSQSGTSIKNFKNDPSNSQTINSNSILSLYFDKHENLWIGTWNGGINKLDLRGQQFVNIRKKGMANDFSKNMIWCITEKNENSFWLGSYRSGICSYKKDELDFVEDTNFKIKGSISALFRDDENKILYIGTWGNGIKAFSLKTNQPILSNVLDTSILKNDRIYSIVKDQNNIIWIGSITHGLFSLNINNQKQRLKYFPYFKELENQTGLGEPEIRSIISDENNVLWLGSVNYGLFKAVTDNIGNIWEIKPVENDIKNNSKLKIRNLFQQKDGNIWLGLNNGVKYYNKKQNTIETIENLNNYIGTGFSEDRNGNFWIATYSGLIKYNHSNGQVKRLGNENIFYALHYNESENEMIACTNKGIVLFNPSANTNNPYYPELIFSKLKIFEKDVFPGDTVRNKEVINKALNYTDTLTLPHNFNIFSIDIATLYYSNQDKIEIYHQLENFENTWNKRTGPSTTVTYTNLSPGEYILKVKVANKDGVWNPKIKQITIIVLPPWWKTIWAYLAYLLLGSIVVVLIRNEIKNRIKLKHDLQIEKIKQEKDHEINQLKLVFFTNISHEIRTPLTLILSPLEDILSSEPKETWIYYQHLIMFKNANLLLRLVNQILDFRKIENENYKLKYSKINLIEFVRQIISQFEGAAETEHINLKFLYEGDSIFLWGDPNKLDQVFFNLLSNAFKYTPENGNIEIKIESINEVVHIEVNDSGAGIPPDDLPHIFERFYQSKMVGREGTGIGLTVVKNIIDVHAGEIEVQSELNMGTSFKIKLPLGKNHLPNHLIIETEKMENKPDEVAEIPKISATTVLETKKMKILTIDDNDDIRNYLKESLKNDYTVYEARNGKEGIEKTLKLLPTLIICDVMMEGMDGIEVCSTLKSNVNTSHIPIIMLTAKIGVENKIEGFEKGADDYITKPFSVKLLKTRLINLIEQRRVLKEKFNNLNLNLSSIGPTSMDEKFLKRVTNILEENMSDNTFSVNELAETLGMTHDQLYRKTKALTGVTANKFIRTIRLRKAAQLIETKKYNISEVLYEVGFSSPSYFSKCFKKEFGVLPTDYKA